VANFVAAKEHRMNPHVRKMKLAALLLLCGAGPARAGETAAQNRVTAVEALATAGTFAVHGTAQPAYTVFKLASPPRLVIDLAGADVSALASLSTQPMASGAVKGITAAQFDQGGQRVGRLVVMLDGDAKYDVKPEGNDLLVSVSGPVAELHAAPAAPVALAAAAPDANLVTTRDDEQAVKTPAHKLANVTLSQGKGQAHVHVATDGQVAHYTLIELKDPARLAVDLHGITGAARKIAGQGDIKAVRVAKHDDGVRVVVDGQGAQMPIYDIQRSAFGLEVTVGAKPAIPTVAVVPQTKAPKLAKVEQPAPETKPAATPVFEQAPIAVVAPEPKAEKPAPVVKPAAKVSVAQVKTVDLEANAEHTQVSIAIDGEFKFDIIHPDSKTVVLTLSNASLPERLERNLDASALGGSIDLLSSYRADGKNEAGEKVSRVKIVATLHAPGSDQIEATKAGLTWKFAAPAAITLSAQPAPQASGSVTPRAGAMTSDPKSDNTVLDDRNYSGRRVDFNVKDIDIRNLLGAIADISKKNIIFGDDVKGTVTLKLRNVPWDQALDIVLKSKQLGKEEQGNIIRVVPIDRLRQEQKDAADAAKTRQSYEPLKVRLIAVNYAVASVLVTQIKDSLSERGTVSVDQRTNTLIVKDVQDSIIRAEGIVRNLDTQTPEVLIEARIVEASISFSREAGIQWGGNVALSPATGNPTGLVFPNILKVAGAADDPSAPLAGLSGVTQPNFAVNMPTAIGLNNGGGLGFVFGSAGGAAQLNLRLSAAENSGNLKTISSPRIQTLDNVEAAIGQGVQIPFSQVSASGVNTQFIEAKLELRVLPHVTQEGAINMKINATNNQPNGSITGSNGQPAITNREAKTQVLVKDGDTTVIGGIYTRTNSEAWTEVPILSRIPILGWLFKKKSVSDQRSELLIFITPHIVNRSESAVANPADDAKQ
jgi:type IV pilus assembly protein PilQ